MGSFVLSALGVVGLVVAGLVLVGGIVYFAVIKPLGPWLNKRDEEAKQLLAKRREDAERTKVNLNHLVQKHGISKERIRQLL